MSVVKSNGREMSSKSKKSGKHPANHKRSGPKTAHATSVRTEFPRPPVNEFVILSAVPIFATGEPGPVSGSPGIYDVVYVLGIPGIDSVTSAVDTQALMNSGNSLLHGSARRIELFDDTGVPRGEARIIPNNRGFLARVHLSIETPSFASASSDSYDLVMPILSRMAYEADVAIDVVATIITERSTQIVQVQATLVGSVQPAPEFDGWSTSELKPFLAVYREGLNSTTPLYQALSFFKIIEGAESFHKKRKRAAEKNGIALPVDPLAMAIPSDVSQLPQTTPWSRQVFEPYLGMSFAKVRDALKDTIRNAVSHLTTGDIRIADTLADISLCREVVPVLRYVARSIIENELDISRSSLGQIPNAGT